MNKEKLLIEYINKIELSSINNFDIKNLVKITDYGEKKILKKLITIFRKSLNNNKIDETLNKYLLIIKYIVLDSKLNKIELETLNNFEKDVANDLKILIKKNKDNKILNNLLKEIKNFKTINSTEEFNFYKLYNEYLNEKNTDKIFILIKNNEKAINFKFNNLTIIDETLYKIIYLLEKNKVDHLDYYINIINILLNASNKNYIYYDQSKIMVNNIISKYKFFYPKIIKLNTIFIESKKTKYSDESKININDILKKYNINNLNSKIDVASFQTIINQKNCTNAITIDYKSNNFKEDAISIKEIDNRYIVGMHITNLAQYIKKDTKIDYLVRENYRTITAPFTYLPMFSPEISKNILSLEKSTYKNVLSLYFIINKNFIIEDYVFTNDTIKIIKNETFKNITNIINKEKCENKNDELIKVLYEFVSYLKNSNKEKDKYRIIQNLNKDKQQRTEKLNNKAHIIIEELTILYNSFIAKTIFENQDIPFIYRVQEKTNNNELLKELSNYETNKNYNKDKILELANLFPKSTYSNINTGHYGLHKSCYAQLSAPGRRYPDIVNQQIITELIINEKTLDKLKQWDNLSEYIKFFKEKEENIKMFKNELEYYKNKKTLIIKH